MKRVLFLLMACSAWSAPANSPPVVSDVRVSQRLDGSGKIDIDYELADDDGDACVISVLVSDDWGSSWAVEASSFTGDIGGGIKPGRRHIVWDSEKDLPGAYGSGYRVRVVADDGYVPLWERSVFVQGGVFEMGDHSEAGDSDERPVHEVRVGSFVMSATEVTNSQYVDFLNSALEAGSIEVRDGVVYGRRRDRPYCNMRTKDIESRIYFDSNEFTVLSGLEDHPAAEVSWYGAVAYCNRLSDSEGLRRCYDPDSGRCDFDADGYRLPSEAEWEYAARGGIEYAKYPWGDEADRAKANWFGSGDRFEPGPYPCTTPVGYYEANGYGLYDMAGNVWEWCNDRYSAVYYSVSVPEDPRGPESGSSRVVRGGCWKFFPTHCRVSVRRGHAASVCAGNIGFRVVRAGAARDKMPVGANK